MSSERTTLDDEMKEIVGDEEIFELDFIVLERKLEDLEIRGQSFVHGRNYLNEVLTKWEENNGVDAKEYFLGIKEIFDRITKKEKVSEEELKGINAPSYVFRICGYSI